jgi:hypothetical protein
MPNLVTQVKGLIANTNEDAAELFEKDFTSKPLPHNTLRAQRKALNNYLRLELSELPVDTTDPRSYLLDSISQDAWLLGIENKVVPVLSSVWYQNKKGTN